MAKSKFDVYAKCPFYKRDVKYSLICEDALASDKTIKTSYSTEEKKEKVICSYCCRFRYRECDIYKFLEKRYASV